MKKILDEYGSTIVYIMLGLGCCGLFWGLLEIVSSR